MARISVVIPTHNRPDLLTAALASVLDQTFTDWEVVVVDDASSPPVTIREDARIRVVRHASSRGGADAKNTGIENATGEILAFLDDDDLYAPQYLERAVTALEHHPGLDVIFMGVSWFGEAGEWGQRNYDAAMSKILAEVRGETASDGVIVFSDSLLDALLKSVPMAFQRPVVTSRALQRIGLYQPNCLLWDCDWAIRAALNARAGFLQESLYLQRAAGQGFSSRGDRKLEHLASGIEIKERLLQETRLGRYPQHLLPKFRKAAAESWFNLAWHYYQLGDRWKALGALWMSELKQISLPNLRLLARLVLPGK